MSQPDLLWLLTDELDRIHGLRETLTDFARLNEPAADRGGIPDQIDRCEIIVPRISDEIDHQVIDRATRLRLIGTPSTGTDHIDIPHAAKRGIRIVSIKDDRAFLDTVQSTAELAWLLILACSRRLRAALDHVRAGGWNAAELRGHELIDRTLGIVGYGRLGTMVSRFAHAFRMKVIATDPQPIADGWVEQMAPDALLERADIITLHVHLNEETRGMIGRDQFARMKPGACLVNTSRGGLIDEDALLDALRGGRLAAAGLDVIEGERDPHRANRPLPRYAADHDNLIITPHVGGVTHESQAKAFMFFARKLRGAWEQIVTEAEP